MNLIKPNDGSFLVSRSSGWDEDKPCDEAIAVLSPVIDERSVDDPKKIPAYRGKDDQWWYGEGENHRVEDGYICRDLPPRKAWAVIGDPVEFVRKHGQCVMSFDRSGILEVEIYDTYRE